jgi:hypothetical protein
MVDSRILECNIIDNGKGLNAHKQSKFYQEELLWPGESFYYSLQIWIHPPILRRMTANDYDPIDYLKVASLDRKTAGFTDTNYF